MLTQDLALVYLPIIGYRQWFQRSTGAGFDLPEILDGKSEGEVDSMLLNKPWEFANNSLFVPKMVMVGDGLPTMGGLNNGRQYSQLYQSRCLSFVRYSIL